MLSYIAPSHLVRESRMQHRAKPVCACAGFPGEALNWDGSFQQELLVYIHSHSASALVVSVVAASNKDTLYSCILTFGFCSYCIRCGGGPGEALNLTPTRTPFIYVYPHSASALVVSVVALSNKNTSYLCTSHSASVLIVPGWCQVSRRGPEPDAGIDSLCEDGDNDDKPDQLTSTRGCHHSVFL
jgi:hypothetical protein